MSWGILYLLEIDSPHSLFCFIGTHREEVNSAWGKHFIWDSDFSDVEFIVELSITQIEMKWILRDRHRSPRRVVR